MVFFSILNGDLLILEKFTKFVRHSTNWEWAFEGILNVEQKIGQIFEILKLCAGNILEWYILRYYEFNLEIISKFLIKNFILFWKFSKILAL